MLLPFLVGTYGTYTETTTDEAERVVLAAIMRAVQKHSDFERFLPGIDFLSQSFFAAHNKIPLDDYLEALYCTVKHGDFTKSWRSQIKAQQSASSEPST